MCELRSIDEVFYSKTRLPIITPDNVQQFISVMKTIGARFHFASLFSGSSRVAHTAINMGLHSLPPIDLRYGWDMGKEEHMRLCQQLLQVFTPDMLFLEPRCKHWSISGNRRDPEATRVLSASESRMLSFAAGLALQQVNSHTDIV